MRIDHPQHVVEMCASEKYTGCQCICLICLRTDPNGVKQGRCVCPRCLCPQHAAPPGRH